jgi:DNA repair ATPase RecN
MPDSIDGDQERQRRELEERLASCRKLAREYTEGMTAKNLRELAAEIEQEIRSLDP